MRIAIPTLNEEFSPHFGKCDGLYICEFDPQTKHIQQHQHVSRPAHDKETTIHWLIRMAVDLILAGGISSNTYQCLETCGIDCCMGMSGKHPIEVMFQYIKEPDKVGENQCPGIQNPNYQCSENC